MAEAAGFAVVAQRDHLLATLHRVVVGRDLAGTSQALPQKLGRLGQINLDRAVIDSASVRAKKGAHNGPAL